MLLNKFQCINQWGACFQYLCLTNLLLFAVSYTTYTHDVNLKESKKNSVKNLLIWQKYNCIKHQKYCNYLLSLQIIFFFYLNWEFTQSFHTNPFTLSVFFFQIKKKNTLLTLHQPCFIRQQQYQKYALLFISFFKPFFFSFLYISFYDFHIWLLSFQGHNKYFLIVSFSHCRQWWHSWIWIITGSNSSLQVTLSIHVVWCTVARRSEELGLSTHTLNLPKKKHTLSHLYTQTQTSPDLIHTPQD